MNSSTTFSFAINERPPEHRALIAQINAHHQLRKDGAPATKLVESEKAIRAALKNFESETTHRRPDWLARALTGEACLSFGDVQGAIEAALDALSLVGPDVEFPDPELAAKSHNNLCEYYRQNGDYAKAVEHGKTACQGLPKNLGMLITWAEALYKAGDKAKAEAVIREVARVSKINEPGDVLGTHLRFEDQLRREMADLATVKSLLDQLN
jgi:tetratricopeptide (TPR) repeat protein